MRSRLLILGLIAMFHASSQAAGTFAECMSLTSELNKTLPTNVNRFTTLKATTCAPGATKATLNYLMSIVDYAESVPISSIREMRPAQLRLWCSTPELVDLLRKFDIRYTYIDPDERFVGDIRFGQQDCAR
jgi:hypothetical protein